MAKTFTINGKIYTDLGKKFDEGTFGEIFLVTDETNKKYILKKAKIFFVDKQQQEIDKEKTEANFVNTEREFDVLKKIESCPNIIKAYGFLREDDDVLFLIEYGEGGDLYNFIVRHQYNRTKISVDTLISITKKLIDALTCFHKLGIYNLDIKPENIIFKDEEQTEPAIIDFGLAVDNSKTPDLKCSFYGGSLGYSAPEILLKKPYDCSKADIYSLGKTLSKLYEITQFDPIDRDRDRDKYYKLIINMTDNRVKYRWDIDQINNYIKEEFKEELLYEYVLVFNKSKSKKSKSKKSKLKKSKSKKSKSKKSKSKKSKSKRSKSKKSHK